MSAEPDQAQCQLSGAECLRIAALLKARDLEVYDVSQDAVAQERSERVHSQIQATRTAFEAGAVRWCGRASDLGEGRVSSRSRGEGPASMDGKRVALSETATQAIDQRLALIVVSSRKVLVRRVIPCCGATEATEGCIYDVDK